MELRLLRYYLTVAKEQSFTKAAEQLHITQPTLSRQMAAFEEDLGITLFIRNGKKISLTDEGILLKRRALEILNLEERTLEELKGKEEVVEGTITIGCGEFAAVETLAKICKIYKEKYPLVQIVLHTATADAVYEMMNKGLVDIALFMEPVDTEGLDYIRITDCDHWCVGMRPDDPLAEKEFMDTPPTAALTTMPAAQPGNEHKSSVSARSRERAFRVMLPILHHHHSHPLIHFADVGVQINGMVQVLAGERSQLAAGIGVGQRGLRRYVQVGSHLLAVRLNHFLRHAHALLLQLVQEALNLLPAFAQGGLFTLVRLLDAAVEIL